MHLLPFLHLLFIGTWFGCVLVEVVFEISAKRNPEYKSYVARLHYWIDLLVEMPAFMGVLVTGLLMIDLGKMSPLYLVKIITGLIPIGVNIFCVIAVILRKRAADTGNDIEIDKNSKRIYWSFIGVSFAFVAFGLGIHFMGLY